MKTTDEPAIAESPSFSTDTAGLGETVATELVELRDGDTFDLRIASVVKQLGDDRVRMLSYNGSIPGPTLRVRQGCEVIVPVRNDGDVESTVHWHGLCLDHADDGVPYETQDPIPIGGSFTYRLRVPHPGLYWYHPHIREDYGLDMGLYGNIVVVSADENYWAHVNREVVVTVDDVLIEDGKIAPFHEAGPNYVAMGRFGNVMLTGGEADLRLEARAGEVVRFYLTNTANTRIFNVRLPGGRMKLVGGDSGRYELEAFVEEVLLAPSERAIVDVQFDAPGTFPVEHRTCPICGMKLVPKTDDEAAPAAHTHTHNHDTGDGLEWEDLMPEINKSSDPTNMIWQLIDRDTGKANWEIDWAFKVGDQVKIRLLNEMDQDHPMHHPFHIHGAGRFLVLSRDDQPEANLVWKDTVLIRPGETVDILLDVFNPGRWMAHCHIAEHNQSGMMFSFPVTEKT